MAQMSKFLVAHFMDCGEWRAVKFMSKVKFQNDKQRGQVYEIGSIIVRGPLGLTTEAIGFRCVR